MTKWIVGWKNNGWRNANGEPIGNRPELEELDKLSSDVVIRYVRVRFFAKSVTNSFFAALLAI
jgi:ribonuclease HI